MFSELVDRAVHAAGRPDALDDLAYWTNVSMREIQKREDFDDDTWEESVVIPVGDRSVIWTPEVGRERFRRLDIAEDGCGCKIKMVKPSSRLRHECLPRMYASGGSYVITTGCSPISLYYYVYVPWLAYFPKDARPAVFDMAENDWNTTDEDAIAQVSNWLLERHSEVVLNGTLAKFFASKQDPRQQVHYSAFEQGISHIIRGESSLELRARE